MLRAVTFDFWDTLVRWTPERPMRDQQIDGFAAVLREAGFEVDREVLVTLFAENWSRFEEAWLDNSGQYTAAETSDFLAGRLGIALGEDLRARLIHTFTEVGERSPLELAPGLEPSLRALAEAGLRLGIVCDVGLTPSPTLRARLDGFGVLRWFDAWAFSDETGWFKPAPEAFTPVLDALGVHPGEAAHVGDNPRTDIAGAAGLGMTAIRYAGFVDRDAEPAGDLIVRDLGDLPALLRVA